MAPAQRAAKLATEKKGVCKVKYFSMSRNNECPKFAPVKVGGSKVSIEKTTTMGLVFEDQVFQIQKGTFATDATSEYLVITDVLHMTFLCISVSWD